MAESCETRLHEAPRGVVANLIFRALVLAEMARNPEFAANVEEICRRDHLFFYNTFCWIYEPRPRRDAEGRLLPKEIPFIAWSHQEPFLDLMESHLGNEEDGDIGAEKSRGEGASWMATLKASKDVTLYDGVKINFVSKDEDAADRKNDSDSLMWKVDFAVARLPKCFVGELKVDYTRNYGDHVLYNVRRGSAITAYAATADVGSGGRADWFLMDELAKFPRPADQDAMASVQFVTDSRLIISTPKGAAGAYYEVMHEPSSMIRVVLDWKDNPSRNRGLYVFKNGLPEAIDPVNNPLPGDYNPPSPQVMDRFERLRRKGFKLEGKVRSPWYDRQCDRAKATPESIARELDRDYGGSQTRALTHRTLDAIEATVRPPDRTGDFVVNQEKATGRFEPSDSGPLSLWMPLDDQGKPPRAMYALAADIALGNAEFGSNSVLTAVNRNTREQVLEYVTSTMEPGELAILAVAIARWLHGANLAWEANGPGSPFGRKVLLHCKYTNVFEEVRIDRKTRKKANKPGWFSTREKKEDLFSEFSSAVQLEELIIRSDGVGKEGGQYIRKDGVITHVSAGNDPSHGDRMIAIGVCWQSIMARPLAKIDEDKPPAEPPAGSIAQREKLDRAFQEWKEEQSWWDERTTASLQMSDQDWFSGHERGLLSGATAFEGVM